MDSSPATRPWVPPPGCRPLSWMHRGVEPRGRRTPRRRLHSPPPFARGGGARIRHARPGCRSRQKCRALSWFQSRRSANLSTSHSFRAVASKTRRTAERAARGELKSTFSRWRPPSGAGRPPHRRGQPHTRPPKGATRNPRMHIATFQLPSQIWMRCPKPSPTERSRHNPATRAVPISARWTI